MTIAQDRLTPAARALIEKISDRPAYSTLTPEEVRSLPTLLSAAPEPVATTPTTTTQTGGEHDCNHAAQLGCSV